ncbi:MAG: hypothetical protein AAB395_01455, partial [Patescibacteria group bacterium]
MISTIIFVILLIDVVILTVFLFQLTLSSQRYKPKPGELGKINRLDDVPSVSLCIPARNETHALADCLTSAISSDYPKLE